MFVGKKISIHSVYLLPHKLSLLPVDCPLPKTYSKAWDN